MTINENAPEGWFTDPFGRHEARWMSDGKPTRLVRDQGVESYDEPPDEPPMHDPLPIDEDPVGGGQDLARADDPEAKDQFDQQEAHRAAVDAALDQTSGIQ